MRFRAELARLGGAAIVAAILACASPDAFVCHDDSQCLAAGQDGVCAPPGYCAFPDPDCGSGLRFGSHAGMGLAGECTDQAGTDSIDPTNAAGTHDVESGSDPPTTSSVDSTASTATTHTTSGTDEGPAVCGDGIVGGDEDCDGAAIPGVCESVGFDGGTLQCNDDCTFDTGACTQCGDGLREGIEGCDGSDLGGQGCAQVGFVGGTLVCSSDCTLDTSACNDCGNAMLDPGEVCDGAGPDELTCVEAGLGGMGFVGCDASTCQLDLGDCGDVLCGSDPDLAVGMCPPECSDCSMGVCVIECTGNAACASAEIVCPEGWPCAVVCEGSSSCSSATVTCPELYGCSMACTGDTACSSAELDCSDAGSCFMTCFSGSNVCSSADVVCGHDECGSYCGGMLMDSELPTVECAMGGCVCGECLD